MEALPRFAAIYLEVPKVDAIRTDGLGPFLLFRIEVDSQFLVIEVYLIDSGSPNDK